MSVTAASMFIDSGAFSLYIHKVKKLGIKDYSFFSLKKGSEFRLYCERYGVMMQKLKGRVLFANVDVIYNPELTWQVQQFFEKEYGVRPIPVVHFRTPVKYLDRYLSAKYDILAIGGFAWGGDTQEWLNDFFLYVCPKSNNHLPVIKVHGFAVTSWHAIVRWPWWSVDSTSWLMTAAYGGIFMPRWSDKKQDWNYDRPPHVVKCSYHSVERSKPGRHYNSYSGDEKKRIDAWLHSIGTNMLEVSGHGNKQGRGEDPSYRARCFTNLTYFKNLEQSRPKWPWPLDTTKVKASETFGL